MPTPHSEGRRAREMASEYTVAFDWTGAATTATDAIDAAPEDHRNVVTGYRFTTDEGTVVTFQQQVGADPATDIEAHVLDVYYPLEGDNRRGLFVLEEQAKLLVEVTASTTTRVTGSLRYIVERVPA